MMVHTGEKLQSALAKEVFMSNLKYLFFDPMRDTKKQVPGKKIKISKLIHMFCRTLIYRMKRSLIANRSSPYRRISLKKCMVYGDEPEKLPFNVPINIVPTYPNCRLLLGNNKCKMTFSLNS